MSQTVGGLPTDRTTKKPLLETIGRVGRGEGGGDEPQSLTLAHDVERLTCQLEVQPGALTEGSCYLVSGLVGQDWPLIGELHRKMNFT